MINKQNPEPNNDEPQTIALADLEATDVEGIKGGPNSSNERVYTITFGGNLTIAASAGTERAS